MISTKKLVRMAQKWQRFVAIRRKRVSFPSSDDNVGDACGTSSEVAKKGHFVVYSVDQKRFELPISYLNNPTVMELLKMSEEEFGLCSDGPLTVPCDAVFMKYLIYSMQKSSGIDLETALLSTLARTRCLDTHSKPHQQSVVCSF